MTNQVQKILALALFAVVGTGVSNVAQAFDPPPQIICACEHLGSQWDGMCEAYVIANEYDAWGNSRILSWDWTPFGQAYMPYGYNNQSGFGYYDLFTIPGTGGLKVTLTYRQTAGTSKAVYPPAQVGPLTCAFGT